MPVLRAELMRSVYRRYFTLTGRVFGALAGGRELTEDVIKEWFYYFYQCTECRRCSVFCPYGIDTAEITMMGRELLNLIGCNINWVLEPAANCFRVGNHLGIQPHGFKDSLDFAADELAEITGLHVDVPINRKGAEILFVMPSADYFGTPHYYTLLGYLMLFHEIGLDYTVSAYASEGGNFGLFSSHEMMKRLNAKIYDEAKRLGVKWILGGECGHMWRVLHQYMDTMNGPADFLEVPVSPITGTRFRKCPLHQDGAHLRVHGRPDPSRQAASSTPAATTTGTSPITIPAIPRAPWACWKSRDTSSRRLQPLSRDAGEHHPRADLLLRQRRRSGHRRKSGNAAARRLSARQCGEVREGKARRQYAGLHLRHRQSDAADRCWNIGCRAWRWPACTNCWATRW